MCNFLHSPTHWIQLASLYPLLYWVSFQVSNKAFRIKFFFLQFSTIVSLASIPNYRIVWNIFLLLKGIWQGRKNPHYKYLASLSASHRSYHSPQQSPHLNYRASTIKKIVLKLLEFYRFRRRRWSMISGGSVLDSLKYLFQFAHHFVAHSKICIQFRKFCVIHRSCINFAKQSKCL